MVDNQVTIGVVGPCGSGKTTLVKELNKLGYMAKQISQEHSYVPDMWKKLSNPDVLIYLDVSYVNTVIRKNINWTEKEFKIQGARLKHAYNNADLVICTDKLSINGVLFRVLEFVGAYSNFR